MPLSKETRRLPKFIPHKTKGKCKFCKKIVENLESHTKSKHIKQEL